VRLNDLPEENITLLLGAPRSGTTWLGRILDSHPKVLYRHEPDVVRANRDIPMVCLAEEVPKFRDMARAYLRGLMNIRTLSCAAGQPIARKSYRRRWLDLPRSAWANLLHAVAKPEWLRRRLRQANLPDLVVAKRLPNVRLVLKSVRSRGRAGLYAAALPKARIIVVLRDPLSQVAAMMRGTRGAQFHSHIAIADLLRSAQARAAGLTEAAYRQMPVLEKLAWNWTILNQKIADDLHGHANVLFIRYDDLCTAPGRVAREVFDFLGLEWHQQTEDYIRACVEYEGPDPAFRHYRNARRSLNRWQGDLRQEDRQRIEAVARTTALWDLCAIPAAQ
jgi:hypothetical protein